MGIRMHPGEIVREEFIVPLNLGAEDFARMCDLSVEVVNGLIHETQDITPDIAARLAKGLNMTPQFWLNLQRAYEHPR